MSRRFAYVEYESHEDCEKAIAHMHAAQACVLLLSKRNFFVVNWGVCVCVCVNEH